jgi:hypothetical protein
MEAEAASEGTPVATATGRSRRERGGRSEVWQAVLARHPRWLLLGAALATALLWFSHLPSLLLQAQFYADDGGWYQSAVTHAPLLSLITPDNGYLVLLQRLSASVSLLLPLVAVPTFFNVIALLVEVGGICYLLSRRMREAIPSPLVRVAIAVLVIALPNAYDTSGNLTDAQWHLGLIAFLVVFADAPRRVWGWICDMAILVLSGLTGPYSILLVPITAWRWLRQPGDRRLLAVFAVNAACAVVQLAVISVFLGAQRVSGTLGAGVLPLITMLGRQLTLGLVAGAHGLTLLVGTPLGDNPGVLLVLAAIPVAACAAAVWRGPAMLRAFCVFATLELALALIAPSITAPRWPHLGVPADVVNFHPGGIRYFLYPLLAFSLSLAWLVTGPGWAAWRRRLDRGARRLGGARTWAVRGAAVGALVLLLLAAFHGVPRDWVYPPYLDLHWGAEVQRLAAAAPGTRVVIPINPSGWSVTLVAR